MNLSDNSSMELAKKRKLEENDLTATTTTLSDDDLRKIIEPFTQEQLSQIVLTASLRHPDVLDAVRSIADRDQTQRKLFIRGLALETTSEKLRAMFATYGDLIEAIVVVDKATGKSKGYGFATYKHIDGALMALKEPSKKIDGRMTVAQLASAGFTSTVTVTANSQTLDVSSRKVYVGNVPADMPEERLLAHFASYGEVEQGPVGFDKNTGKSKGFALFIYKNVEGARASLVDPVKTIDGHVLHCKLANDKRGNPSGVAVKGQVAAMGQVQGSGVGVKPEVNVNQQSSMQGSFAPQFGGGGPIAIPAFGGNLGGLGLPGGPGGISGYGGVGGQGLPFSHSQHPDNFNLGAFGSNGGGAGLSTNGSQVPRQGLPFSHSHPENLNLGAFGGNGGGAGLSTNGSQAPRQGLPFSHSQHPENLNLGSQVPRQGLPLSQLQHPENVNLGSFGSNGGDAGLPTNGSQVPSSVGGGGGGGGLVSGLGSGGYGGSHFGVPGASYGLTGSGAGVGLGNSFGGSGQRSLYSLPPASARMRSGANPESAHYSLSSGSVYQTQLQDKTGVSPITKVPTRSPYPYK